MQKLFDDLCSQYGIENIFIAFRKNGMIIIKIKREDQDDLHKSLNVDDSIEFMQVLKSA